MVGTMPLVLLAVLNVLSCHSDVRARDPEEMLDTTEAGQIPPHLYQHLDSSFSADAVDHPQKATVPINPPAQRGNWCSYVSHRMVSTAVLSSTDSQTVKSVKPCGDGDPHCQLTVLFSRPEYKLKQRRLSSVHWRCCPGYRGRSCLDRDGSTEDEKQVFKPSNIGNDNSGGKPVGDLLDDAAWHDSRFQETTGQAPSQPAHNSSPNAGEDLHSSQPLPFLDSSVLLTMHQFMSTMMSQIQPVLERFNQTLENLSGELDVVTRELQQLRMEREENDSLKSESHSGWIEKRLVHNNLQIGQMKNQLAEQSEQVRRAFHTQQEQFHHNLTRLKEETDELISSRMNLQTLSEMVERVKVETSLDRDTEDSDGGLSSPESRLWSAITRLNHTAESNRAQLSILSDTSEDTWETIQDLQKDLGNLGQSMEEVKQRSEVRFSEAGLDVDASRVKMLNSINELIANQSAHEGQLKEIEMDLDHIYQLLQASDSPAAVQTCSCPSLGDAVSKLELEVVNVRNLTKHNQMAIEDAWVEKNQGHLVTKIEDLHQGLLNIKEALAFEQSKSRTLDINVSHLKASLVSIQREISALREKDEAKSAEIQGLSATFSSLLNDALRHSQVLEVLLGEEVLEFTQWSHAQQKELSISELKERMHLMEHKLGSHGRNLTSLQRKHPGEHLNSDDPEAYSSLRDAGNFQLSLEDPSAGEEDVDYSVSDFWSLGKEVEQLAGRISWLEERCGNYTETPSGSVGELKAKIESLSDGLEAHLNTFKSLFSHTEELAGSSRSINLDQVWKMIRRKQGKNKTGPQNQEKQPERQESSVGRRKRHRETGSSFAPTSPVAFISTLDFKTRGNLTSRNVAVNYGGTFDPRSGVFQASETGLYLFLVHLNFKRAPSLAVLRQNGVPVASLRQEHWENGGAVSRSVILDLQRGETVTVELIRGSLREAKPEGNTLSGLLLFIRER